MQIFKATSPPAEAKSPNIKKLFTPALNMAEKFSRLDVFIISLCKRSGTKITFGGGRRYKFGFNRKSTDWKGTDWLNYEPTDPSSLAHCFSLRERVLKEHSQAFLNRVNAELESVTCH